VIRKAALILAFALLACDRGPAAPAAKAGNPGEDPPRHIDRDGDNLLNIAYGAALVSRTEELDLDHSGLHAIDGMHTTFWQTPPHGTANHTAVFSFGAPVRVDRVGLISRSTAASTPASVRFSASADARTWREIVTINTKVTGDAQVTKVTPFEANFLRVDTGDPKDTEVEIISFQAFGEEIYPAEVKPFDGCWTVNGERALIVQRGARITGVIGEGKGVTALDGGTDGRVARVMWMRGPMWGYAAMTISADGRHMSALTFHKNPLTGYSGRAWIGHRCETNQSFEAMPPAHFVNRAGHWTLNGLAFDEREQLIETMSRDTLETAAKIIAGATTQRFRITAYEFRHAKDENRQRTAARIASLRTALEARGVDLSRVELEAKGDDWPLAEPVFAVQRLLWSRIDLALQ
jgi:F5/8 type C domain